MKIPEDLQADELIESVARDARLAEGSEGVRKILRAVYLEGSLPIRNLSQQVELPVPVVAAVRGELESRGVLTRKGGVSLTEQGRNVVQEGLGISGRVQFPKPVYPSIEGELGDVLNQLRRICDDRPNVDVRLDQSHATPETALRRAAYLYANDALEGRKIVIIGDDDLTSIAIALLARHYPLSVRKIVVLEVDSRLVAYLRETGDREGFELEVREYDLRQRLPNDLNSQFDVFLTDPPYTIHGLRLFASRGAETLIPGVGKQGYICFGSRKPDEGSEVIRSLIEIGFVPVEIVPNFNSYDGAQLLGGVSQMIRTISTGKLSPLITDHYTGSLYTADRKKNGRS